MNPPTPARNDRREILKRSAMIAATWALSHSASQAAEAEPLRSGMGLVIYDCNHRRRQGRNRDPKHDLFEPLTFLKHCHSVGAGGMQVRLGTLSTEAIDGLKAFAHQHDLFIDAIVSPPVDSGDLSRFEAEIRVARDVGVQAARTTIIPGRRYERFKTLDEFRTFEKRGEQMLQRAAAILQRHQVPLAVENHKDQRIDERVKLFEKLDHEYIGACVDTGNSFALLDGAYEPIEALAPFAFTVHLKDQALQSYEDGFLLADIPLGQGSFDLKRMVSTIRDAKPEIRFSLELITRDPLKVPCLTEAFWATMPQVPAADLVRNMTFVREHTVADLQYVSRLSPAQQVALEDANVTESLRYAATELGI